MLADILVVRSDYSAARLSVGCCGHRIVLLCVCFCYDHLKLPSK